MLDKLKRDLLKKLSWIQFFICFFLTTKKRNSFKNVAIVRLDAIGDYFLFRNFLEHLRNSLPNDYKITLIGNSIWKDLATTYDCNFVDQFVWVNPTELQFSPAKTFRFIKLIRTQNYQMAINPAYSPTDITDAVLFTIKATEYIGNTGDVSKYTKIHRFYSKYYDRLITTPVETKFEFNRAIHFFEQLTKVKVPFRKPYIKELESKNVDLKRYVVVFVGAGNFQRRWDINNFNVIITRILEHDKNIKVVLSGSPSEQHLAEILNTKTASSRIINKIGKTSLVDLVYLIKSSCLVISNETSAIHIAVTTNTPSICILGGGHFGRFAPNNNLAGWEKHTSVYYEMDCYGCNWNCTKINSNNEVYPCISNIGIEKVWSAIVKINVL